MTRHEERRYELLALEQRSRGDRVGVTVGRAAQMLRMTRRAVWNYIQAEALSGEWIEGAEVRGGKRVSQFILRKGEVRRFQRALEDARRRAPVAAAGGQLRLQLLPARPARMKPAPWDRYALYGRFRMAKAGLQKAKVSVHDREPKPREVSKGMRRVS